MIVFCDQLFDPANGNVDLTGVTEGSTATYTCDQRFEIIFGDKLRTCQSDGQWSGDEPICEGNICTHYYYISIFTKYYSELANTWYVHFSSFVKCST